MTTSKYPDDFRDRFCRQEWNNLTETQREVMCRQYELYDALRRTGSEMDKPSFMLAHHKKVRHSPCSRCSGDDQYIAHRAMMFKELEDELEEQHQRKLSQQAEGSPIITARRRRVKSRDNVSKDSILRSVDRTNVGVEYSSKNTKTKQNSSVQRCKEHSKPRDRTSSKRRHRSKQPRKMNSVKKNSHSTNRTVPDLYNRDSSNQRLVLRGKSSNKRSSEVYNKPSSEERSSPCENTFQLQEYFNDEETGDTGFGIPADSQDTTINKVFGKSETAPSLVTPDTTPSYGLDEDRRVTFDELDEIFDDTHSREQQIESLRRLLHEKAKKKVIPLRSTCPNSNHLTRSKSQAIPKTQIVFSLPTIERKRIPRKKQEVTESRDLRAKQEVTTNCELPTQPARRRCKRKSLPCVKKTREHNVRGSHELRKQRSYRKEPKVNASQITNTSNRKRSVRPTTQRSEWNTSTAINHQTNDISLLQPPKAQQSKRRSASKISEPKRVITSRKVEQNLERCNRKQKKCVPEHSRRHPKKKRARSASNNNMANTRLREPPEQGCFHWVSADETHDLQETCTSKVPSPASLPRTNKKRLGRKKLGNSNTESLKYERVAEEIPHAFFEEIEPIEKKGPFHIPRVFSTGPSRNRNKPLVTSHLLY